MMDIEDLDEVLGAMMMFKPGVSDLNFTVGRPPQVEVDGNLEAVTFSMKPEPLVAEETEAIAMALVGDKPPLMEALEEIGACDTAHMLGTGARVRVNVFRVRNEYSIVLRALPSGIPNLGDLELPETLRAVPKLLNGLVLVTGATGSGKTTTMNALLDAVNELRPVHVITLEDPVEFQHEHKLATMNQRELGTDFRDYAEGLRSALRQAPKVLFVGEIRDRETMEIALKAAETGHLVLSTLHTIDAGQTINRIVGMFDSDESQFVRARLADVVRFVISQRLLPKDGGGRVAAVEIMGNNLRVRELILHGEHEDKTFRKVIADSRSQGWQTFDQHLLELYQEEIITEETVEAASSDTSYVRRGMDQVRARRGQSTSDIGDLEMAYTRKIRR